MQVRDEGTIKYNISWTKADLPAFPVTKHLLSIRNRLHELGLIGVYPDGIGYGNISARIDVTNQFIISGTQTGNIPVLNAEQLSLVTSCYPDANKLVCTGPVKASSEAMTHHAFYAASENIKSVIHIHHAAFWKDHLFKLRTTSDAIAYGTPEMAGEIKKLLSEDEMKHSQNIILMAGHAEGIFFYGASLVESNEILMTALQQYFI